VLADTAGVKMMLVTLPPGARLVTHTHPIQMGHVIKGGLYQWTFDDKKIESFQMEPGASFHGGAEGPHHSWNGGNTTIQFVFVEKRDLGFPFIGLGRCRWRRPFLLHATTGWLKKHTKNIQVNEKI
jgi:hypothetical protein